MARRCVFCDNPLGPNAAEELGTGELPNHVIPPDVGARSPEPSRAPEVRVCLQGLACSSDVLTPSAGRLIVSSASR